MCLIPLFFLNANKLRCAHLVNTDRAGYVQQCVPCSGPGQEQNCGVEKGAI
jgi:hypothetical protein